MGNRAVIRTNENTIGVYLHWNGGRDTIEPVLAFCKASGYRSPEYDCYGWAYLCTVLGCFFGDGMHFGIDVIERLETDNCDNGTYIIEGWEIVGREFVSEGFKEQSEYNFGGMLEDINERMPVHMRLSPQKMSELKGQHNAKECDKG